MTDTFIDTRNPATEQAILAFGSALSNAFDPDYQAQRATARIKNQLAQAEAQNALGYQQEQRAAAQAAQGIPEDVRLRYNERDRLQQEAMGSNAQNAMMPQLSPGTPEAESQRAYRILNDLPAAPNVAAENVAEKGTPFPGFYEEQARTQKQAMGETAQNANVGSLSPDALFSPAMKQRAESNAQLIAGLEDQYKALQLQVSPLNPNQQMRLSAIQQQYALKEKMAAAKESQAKIGVEAQNEIATVMAKLGPDVQE